MYIYMCVCVCMYKKNNIHNILTNIAAIANTLVFVLAEILVFHTIAVLVMKTKTW